VLLAHAHHDVVDTVLSRALVRYTRYTVTDPARVRAILADIRRNGHVISDRQVETISVSIAAPVRDASGTVVAALSIVVATGQPPRAFVPAVVSAARGISRILSSGATTALG
jgi:DNA-binding IclR family transcriptional regulator